MFAGMMVGAIGWGTCSDIVGRSAAFNATLSFTAFFGILASFASSFWALCVLLFFLGSAVGVSSPSSNVVFSLTQAALSRVLCRQTAHSFLNTCQKANSIWSRRSQYSSLSDLSFQHLLLSSFFLGVRVHQFNLAVPPLQIMAGSICLSVLAPS